MTRLRIGGAIAAVLLVAVGGAYLLLRNTGVGPVTPTATPAITPSVPPAFTTSIPDSLLGRWMGGPKTQAAVPGLAAGSGIVLTFTTDKVALAQANQMNNALFNADATTTGAGQFTMIGSLSCATTDEGVYLWHLSASDRLLTISLLSDPCAMRRLAIPGDYEKSVCKLTADLCLGDLSAGTYWSQYIDPRIKAGSTWAPKFGAIGYTVPAGWANSSDWPSEFTLTPSANYALETADGAPAGTWYHIAVMAQPAVNDPDVDCFTGLTTVPRTVDAFIAHLVASPAITATAPQSITIDGHAAQWIDIAKDPAWKGTCGKDAGGAANVLIDTGLQSRWIFGPIDSERARIILVDIGNGDLVLIVLDAGDGTKLAQLATDAMPIVQTFTFE